MNTPINTHFNVSDQELAAANGGGFAGPLIKGAGKAIAKGVAAWFGWEAASRISEATKA